MLFIIGSWLGVIREHDKWRDMRAALPILAACGLAAAPVPNDPLVTSICRPKPPSPRLCHDTRTFGFIWAVDHQAAVKLVTGELRQALHLRELHVPSDGSFSSGVSLRPDSAARTSPDALAFLSIFWHSVDAARISALSSLGLFLYAGILLSRVRNAFTKAFDLA